MVQEQVSDDIGPLRMEEMPAVGNYDGFDLRVSSIHRRVKLHAHAAVVFSGQRQGRYAGWVIALDCAKEFARMGAMNGKE